MNYDIAIVGAGPAGLMAAKRASEQGLKVVLIEKRKDISKITRACCQFFIMDEDFQGETIRIEDNSVVFNQNKFEVAYSGPLLSVTDKYFISPGGHKIHFAHEDKKPLVIKFDKGQLLHGLLEDCVRLGVEFLNASKIKSIEDRDDKISISLTRGNGEEKLTAKKLVIADGVNTPAAEMLGLNSGRALFTKVLVTVSTLEGVKNFEPATLKSYMGAAYRSFAPVIMGPAFGSDDMRYLVLIGTKERRPEKLFEEITMNSPLKPMFENARIVKKAACTATAYSSMKVPHRGNVLVIGDAAAYVEVETQGALTCGYRAADAVFDEIENKKGFEAYTKWWQDSFEFNGDDYLQVAQGFALVPTYTDDELDYLFALIEGERLEGTYNQYKSPKVMWGAILKHRERISLERPALIKKIDSRKLLLSDSL